MGLNISFGNTSGIDPKKATNMLQVAFDELMKTTAVKRLGLTHLTIESISEDGVTLTDRQLVHIPADQLNGLHTKLLALLPTEDDSITKRVSQNEEIIGRLALDLLEQQSKVDELAAQAALATEKKSSWSATLLHGAITATFATAFVISQYFDSSSYFNALFEKEYPSYCDYEGPC